MAKSYTPLFQWPGEDCEPFSGERVGGKLVKDIRDVPQDGYGGWWPTFFPTTVGFLVTGEADKYNVMTISCVVVCCAHPFTVGFPVFGGEKSTRGDGPRYSLGLLQEHREFTLNISCIDPQMTKRALICGSLSGRDGTDKFQKAGLTPEPSLAVGPPRIAECPLNLEAKVHSMQELGTHTWVMGRVQAVSLDADVAEGRKHFLWRSMPEMV